MSIALGHMQHAYMQTDGTYKFPNSREGDILKQARVEILELEKQLTEANRIKDQLLIAANIWEDRYKAALQGDVIYSADYWSVREKALRGEKE